MKRQKVLQLIAMLGRKPQSGGGWVKTNCPFAHWKHTGGTDRTPSFGVSVEQAAPSWYSCFTCGVKGELPDMIFSLRRLNKKDKNPDVEYDWGALMALAMEDEEHVADLDDLPDYDDAAPTLFHEFPDDWLSSFKLGHMHPYLEDRGIRRVIAKELDVRFDFTWKRICLPFRDFKGRLAGMQGRDVTGESALRYMDYGVAERRNPDVWIGESFTDLDEPVVLTEGPFDYMKIFSVYRNVLASRTSHVNQRKMNRLRGFHTIITFYDYGTGGDFARRKLSGFADQEGIEVVHYTPSMQIGDAGAMSERKIAKILSPYVDIL